MWFKRDQNKNRRLHRHNVLDVKLRSDQVRASRMRLGVFLFLTVAGPFFGLYLLWRVGEVMLNAFVYENNDFAIQQVDVQTDGVIAPEQLRRWAGVKPGANLIALDLSVVKRNLELVPAVESVSVERVLPRTLKIHVAERQPIAQVNVPRTDGPNGVAVSVFQLDVDGVVILPLDPRLCVVSLAQLKPELPVISGLNAFQLQPGRRVELPPVQAALKLVAAFASSPMAGLVDLRRVDVSQPGVLVVTTGQGSAVTFRVAGDEELAVERQLARWRLAYDEGVRRRQAIATLDLAVANNSPVTWMLASSAPVTATPKTVKPKTTRRKNV
jgi:cell division septal protein FtsQ